MYEKATEEDVLRLAEICGRDNVSTSGADRAQHAGDQSGHTHYRPDVVVWPGTAGEVAAILRLAHERCIPLTPWGAGTSLEGNPIPVRGGILLSTARMQQIVAVHADDFQVTVQPGVGRKELNQYLRPYGLFFAPDPGANASIGGMLANNAAGLRTVRYGATRDNVLAAEVALPDGQLIRVGSRSVKQSSGYDLLHLFVGSEGTLGIFTEATLRLVPVPRFMSAVVASFPAVEAAVETVVLVRGSGLEPAALEFVDAYYAQLLSQAEGVSLAAQPTLFMEFHAAHETALEMGLAMVREICEEMGALDIQATSNPAERGRLWQARHDAYEITVRNHPGQRMMIVDVCVPLSSFPALVSHVQQVLAERETVGYLLGHAGDGNLHVTMPFADEAERQRALAVNDAIVTKAIALDGTATGEHGVGIGKARYMEREHGPALGLMRALKETIDPRAIMNPGKIFPG